MSDEQKNNQSDGQKPESQVNKPAAAPLPGLGAKPGAGPLPGLGAKPGAGPLPGLGAKPGAAPLPGLGGAAVVPPFMQQAQPEKPKGPDMARDPFGAQPSAPRSSYAPPPIVEDTGGAITASEMKKSNKPLIIGAAIIFGVAFLLGTIMHVGLAIRTTLNQAIRDAMIVEYELKKSAKALDDAQTVLGTALQKTQASEYDQQHIDYLDANISGNPVKATIFTERNYKTFAPEAVQWMSEYYNNWSKLSGLIVTHVRETKNDAPALTAAKADFKKLMETQFGVVFKRDDQGKFLANLVLLAGNEVKGGKTMANIQAVAGTPADQRELYNPEGEDTKLTAKPEDFVVEVGPESKATVLKDKGVSQYQAYVRRIIEITDVMKAMTELKKNLLGRIGEIASQDPAGFLGGIDPQEEFDEYVRKDKTADAEAGK